MTRCPGCGERVSGNKKPESSRNLILVLVGVLLVAAIVAGIIWAATRNPDDQPVVTDPTQQTGTEPTEQDSGEPTAEELAAHPVLGRDNYNSEANSAGDMSTVVATLGDVQLTNGQLSVWYWQNYYDLLNQAGYYISYYGLDTTKPLEDQSCLISEVPMNWQQFMVENALNNWHSYVAMAMEAEKAGTTLSEEDQTTLDTLEEIMNEDAVNYGYADALEMLQSDYGTGVNLEDYKAFLRVLMLGNQYYLDKSEELSPSASEVSDYYDQNEATFILQGVEKVDMPSTVDVRHILIQPEEEAAGENGSYTQEQLDAARVQAQALLDQWKAGDATEESFGLLATEKTMDSGSKDSGGLYEGVYPGQMVTEFNDWCFDPNRKTGDTDLVQTTYGIHIMYFVSASGDIYWYEQAEAMMMQETMTSVVEAAMAAYPYEVDFQKIYLSTVTRAMEEY